MNCLYLFITNWQQFSIVNTLIILDMMSMIFKTQVQPQAADEFKNFASIFDP